MSNLSLLFTPAASNLVNASGMNREIERESFTAEETTEHICIGTGSGGGHYRLPSGIVSLDHWLDLNA